MTDLTRELQALFEIDAETPIGIVREVLGKVLPNHWVAPAPPPPANWMHSRVAEWDMSFVGPGGAYSIVATASAPSLLDGLVVLVVERLQELGLPVDDRLGALASDLLMSAKAKILRDRPEPVVGEAP